MIPVGKQLQDLKPSAQIWMPTLAGGVRRGNGTQVPVNAQGERRAWTG